MSHTTRISAVQIKDEAAIVSAIEALQERGIKIDLKRDATVRMWYEAQTREIGKCDYVLTQPGCRFDVGLKRNKDGYFDAICDVHADMIGRAGLGGACAIPQTPEERSLWNIGAFAQEYAKHAAINAAFSAGYVVEGTTVDEKTGEINLVLAGM